ncbi:MAG: retropepsin-like aspartic protease, partial [Candidatus Dormibacteria bacterium]
MVNAEQFLGTERQPLSQPCSVRGYDGQSRQEITHLIHLTLEIAGRVQKNIPFLILELKGHDLILGKKWLANSNALLDCKEERIIWRNGLITEKRWNRILTTTAESLLNRAPLPEHQTNAERRDQLMALEEKKWKPKKILSQTEPQ